MNVKLATLIASGSLLAAGAGYFAAVAISAEPPPPSRTVTVDVGRGATGPAGPAGERGPAGPPGARGATGAQGPAGDFSCIAGYSPGILQLNAPGGQVRIYTCLEDE